MIDISDLADGQFYLTRKYSHNTVQNQSGIFVCCYAFSTQIELDPQDELFTLEISILVGAIRITENNSSNGFRLFRKFDSKKCLDELYQAF